MFFGQRTYHQIRVDCAKTKVSKVQLAPAGRLSNYIILQAASLTVIFQLYMNI